MPRVHVLLPTKIGKFVFERLWRIPIGFLKVRKFVKRLSSYKQLIFIGLNSAEVKFHQLALLEAHQKSARAYNRHFIWF